MVGVTQGRVGGALRERGAIVALMLLLFAGGYYAAAAAVDPGRARSLATPLDARIPFLPWTLYVYVSTFPGALAPAFFVRCPRLFRRVALAYTAVMGVSFATFVAFPVTAIGLRPDPSSLPLDGLTRWGLAWLYRLDPPLNLFPSMHVAFGVLVAAAAAAARRAWGWLAGSWVVAFAISVCTVKQHYAIDAAAGAALGLAAWALLLRSYRPARHEDPALSGRWAAGFLAGCAGLYAAALALYLAGVPHA
jgi:membrane-associated phospholipid phosphatase